MKKCLSVVLLILSASLLFADVPTSLQDNIKAISTIRETIDPLILQIKQVQANDDLGRQRGFFAFKITFLSTFLTDSAFRDTPEVRRLKATAAEFKANPDPAFLS